MSLYPVKIQERLQALTNAGTLPNAAASASGASFECGASLEFSLAADEFGIVTEARFRAAGCGYLLAVAELLTDAVRDKPILDFRFEPKQLLENDAELREVTSELPAARKHCAELCFETLERAVDNYRRANTSQYNGDEALICTCFGVSETTIVNLITENALATAEQVTALCNAGGGCGSCRPLIEDVLLEVRQTAGEKGWQH